MTTVVPPPPPGPRALKQPKPSLPYYIIHGCLLDMQRRIQASCQVNVNWLRDTLYIAPYDLAGVSTCTQRGQESAGTMSTLLRMTTCTQRQRASSRHTHTHTHMRVNFIRIHVATFELGSPNIHGHILAGPGEMGIVPCSGWRICASSLAYLSQLPPPSRQWLTWPCVKNYNVTSRFGAGGGSTGNQHGIQHCIPRANPAFLTNTS